jgi:hypothetical protein
VDESIEKMRTAAHILHVFKDAYEDHKNRLKSYFSEDMEILKNMRGFGKLGLIPLPSCQKLVIIVQSSS